MSNKKFIVFEGVDGSGKSTQIKKIEKFLKSKGIKVFSTFEPTKSNYGKLIRNLLKRLDKVTPFDLASLFVSDRLSHLLGKNGICDKLSKGYVILCDRFYLSNCAYQGKYLGVNTVIDMNKDCLDILTPSLTIYVDVPPEIAYNRIKNSGRRVDDMETKENIFVVHDLYKECISIRKDIDNITTIDGCKSIDAVHSDIKQIVSNYLGI